MRKLYIRLAPIPLLALVAQFAAAQLVVSPGQITLPSFGAQAAFVDVYDINGAHVKFKYAGVQTVENGPNFILVIPSSGTTPASVQIALNPNVLARLAPGGAYGLAVNFTVVDQAPATGTGPQNTGPVVILKIPAEAPPNIQSVVNAASLQPLLSPGAQVSILGSHLTDPKLSTTYDDTASYPTSMANTSVTFNGIAAPLLYLSPGKIKAIVPYALAGQTSVQVEVQHFNQVSNILTSPLQDTSPAIFTHNGAGRPKILQQGANGQFTRNSPHNPATAGTTLEIFATGSGVWTPPAPADLFIFGSPFTTQPVSVTIGGQPAKILYAGTSGTYGTWSVIQVNAVVPDGLPSGPQPLVLSIGQNSNSQQQVTVAIQ